MAQGSRAVCVVALLRSHLRLRRCVLTERRGRHTGDEACADRTSRQRDMARHSQNDCSSYGTADLLPSGVAHQSPLRDSVPPRAPHGGWATLRRQVSWLAARAPIPAFPSALTCAFSGISGQACRLQLRGQPRLGSPRIRPCSLFIRRKSQNPHTEPARAMSDAWPPGVKTTCGGDQTEAGETAADTVLAIAGQTAGALGRLGGCCEIGTSSGFCLNDAERCDPVCVWQRWRRGPDAGTVGAAEDRRAISFPE